MENGKETVEGAEIQRWTARRKMAVVLDLIRGKTSAVEVASQYGLTIAKVEQ